MNEPYVKFTATAVPKHGGGKAVKYSKVYEAVATLLPGEAVMIPFESGDGKKVQSITSQAGVKLFGRKAMVTRKNNEAGTVTIYRLK